MATPEENKAIYRRLIEEVWNRGNLAVADELLAPDATAPSAPQLPLGPEGLKAVVRIFRTAFPDFYMTIEDIIAEGDKVAARFVEGGTHQGVFMGIAPTGRRVTFREIAIVRIVNGKVVESRWEVDMLGLYQQIGAVTPPG
ncbi:MAG TPA: ester cyclase [Terriglobia bacterium]|nr:ester cyclase [Terriglobia bacterium]